MASTAFGNSACSTSVYQAHLFFSLTIILMNTFTHSNIFIKELPRAKHISCAEDQKMIQKHSAFKIKPSSSGADHDIIK